MAKTNMNDVLLAKAMATSAAKAYTDNKTAALMGGVKYKGSVSYYADLPTDAEEGDAYTVKYSGTSGSELDGTEYVWGIDSDSNELTWISFSKDTYSKAEADARFATKVLTGYTPETTPTAMQTIAATDSVIDGFEKLDNNVRLNESNILLIAENIEAHDYGVANGCTVNNMSAIDVSYSISNSTVTFSKSANSNANIKILLNNNLISGDYKINVEFNKSPISSQIALYEQGSVVDTLTLTDNKVEFTSSLPNQGFFDIRFIFPYNQSNISCTITALNPPRSYTKVVADNISDRVEELEQIPYILGSTNTFFGKNAGINTAETQVSDPDDGKYNTAFGLRAMEKNTSGDHCTSIGFCALAKNTTGDSNTALGEDALYENTTGGYSVAVGTHSLQDANGGANTGIGANAGRHITGAGNIFIGANVMPNQRSINNAIVIGAYADTTTDGDIKIGTDNTLRLIFRINNIDRLIEFNNDGTVTWSTIT